MDKAGAEADRSKVIESSEEENIRSRPCSNTPYYLLPPDVKRYVTILLCSSLSCHQKGSFRPMEDEPISLAIDKVVIFGSRFESLLAPFSKRSLKVL